MAQTQPQNLMYLWGNGSIENSINVSETNYYWVSATNSCGTYIDSAYILFYDCDLNAPNVFTPNNDGNNDVLFIYGNGLNEEILFQVYNRWGDVVYSCLLYTSPSPRD